MAINDVQAGKIIISGDTTLAVEAIKKAQESLAALTAAGKSGTLQFVALQRETEKWAQLSEQGLKESLKDLPKFVGHIQQASNQTTALGKAWEQVKGFAAGYVGTLCSCVRA